MTRARIAIVAAAVLAPTAAGAEPELELGLSVGAHRFAADVELGVDDRMDEPGPSSAPLLGARIGLVARGRLGVEAELVLVPTSDDVLGVSATAFGLRVRGVGYLLAGRIRPFVVAVAGAIAIRGGGPQLDDDVDRALHWGGGVRIAVARAIELRLDLRHVVVPDRTAGGATSDVELQAGVVWSFGRRAPRPSRPIEPPAIEPPAIEPPAIAPRVIDTDGDGLPDDRDRCPIDAETANGWSDDDGCPDEILAELAGIEFERGSARIDPASRPLLDRTVAILGAAPTLVIEISGHTSADGEPARNQALSQARADAVKAYLVSRGIDADRLIAIGHGADHPLVDDTSPEARRRNRRIELRVVPPSRRE